MYMRLDNEDEDEGSNGSLQLPSFVDVVFILLIFFLVLSIVGFGVVESGSHSSDSIYDKEQDVSDFPAVRKALQKDIAEYLTLALRVTDQDMATYYVFSSSPFYGVIIENEDEYQTIRTQIENNQFMFNSGTNEAPLKTLQAVWGPFSNADAMSKSRLVLHSSVTNLIIQASEEFTYHQILEVMRLFSQYKSVYFEVIENGTTN